MDRHEPTSEGETLRATGDSGTADEKAFISYISLVRLSVVLGEWLNRPISADIDVAVMADRAGYPEVWVGEMAKLDAPVAAAVIASNTERIELCLGPLAVTVRSSVQIALAASTVAATTRRPVHVALGTSSDVVARWHGRTRRGAADALARGVGEVRTLLDGGRVSGFRLREPPPASTITVAAFGPRAVAAAANADRMVLNMVTLEAAAQLAPRHPNTAAWLAVAVDPDEIEIRRLAGGYVPYLAAPGYGEMFAAAGFGELVAFAGERPSPKELAARVPNELVAAVALVGDEASVRARIDSYHAAGVREIGLVLPPVDTDVGRRTIEALAPASHP